MARLFFMVYVVELLVLGYPVDVLRKVLYRMPIDSSSILAQSLFRAWLRQMRPPLRRVPEQRGGQGRRHLHVDQEMIY